jgi:hypothetical protein
MRLDIIALIVQRMSFYYSRDVLPRGSGLIDFWGRTVQSVGMQMSLPGGPTEHVSALLPHK